MENIISIINTYLKKEPVSKAYLFGSYARGENNELSDIDLLLELKSGVTLFELASIKVNLESLTGKTIDLVTTNGTSPYIKPFIDTDKRLIYEA